MKLETVRALATALCIRAGLPAEDATLVIDVLLDADLRGVHSHGLWRLPSYIARLEAGSTKASPNVRVVKEQQALSLIDGGHGLGIVVADRALSLTLDKARSYGVAATAIRASGHMGAIAYYTRKGAQQGFATLIFSNSSPGMVPPNGLRPTVGLNPWSIAVPGPAAPICMDMANTVAARGKILVALNEGRAIPDGWAVDASGQPTTDPVAALAGGLLPMGGHKGYVLSVMVDMLAAILPGAAFLTDVASPRDAGATQDIGHLFMALDIAQIMPLDVFKQRVARYSEMLKASPTRGEEVLLPGEPEERARETGLDEVALEALWREIRPIAQRYGIDEESIRSSEGCERSIEQRRKSRRVP